MNDWEIKQQEKAERYRELAEKHKKESESRYEQYHNNIMAIPMGQPILVGHHSERGHRAHLKRCDNHMRKSIEHSEKAEYYENKAKGVENNNSISSDDPEAIKKLKEKLEKLENKRVAYKEHNKKARKEGKDTLPSWALSNLSQNIRSVKQRIEYLERQKNIEDNEEEVNGVTIKVNKEDNRVQLFFPSIPSREVR